MTTKTASKASSKKSKTSKSAQDSGANRSSDKSTAVHNPPTLTADTGDNRSLRLWNIRLGVALLLLAGAVVLIGDSSTTPLTTQYLAKDALATEAAGGNEVFASATRHLADVRVSWLVAAFLTIASGMYLMAATVWRRRYEAWLDRGVNKLRWAGLGLAGGVAASATAMLGGVSDLATLLLVFGSVVLAGVFAAALELLGPGRRLRRLLATGAVSALALPWLGLALNIGGALKYNGAVPSYLYFVYAALTLWFVAFIMATYFRVLQRGKWADSMYAERAFMLLGFSAVLVLALQIFVGALQP